MIEGEKTTAFLENVLCASDAEQLEDYFDTYKDKLAADERAFTNFMRDAFAAHKRSQRDVFIAADLSEKYGYALISGEKHTTQRDNIVKLCLAGHFTLAETQTALKLYGMSELYAKIGRDACLIIAVNTALYEIADVDELLMKHGFEELYQSKDIA